jgi:hypothetical protein
MRSSSGVRKMNPTSPSAPLKTAGTVSTCIIRWP